MATEQYQGLNDSSPDIEFTCHLGSPEPYDEAGQVERRMQLECLKEVLTRVDAGEMCLDIGEF